MSKFHVQTPKNIVKKKSCDFYAIIRGFQLKNIMYFEHEKSGFISDNFFLQMTQKIRRLRPGESCKIHPFSCYWVFSCNSDRIIRKPSDNVKNGKGSKITNTSKSIKNH